MANRFLNNITINDEYTLPSADGTADQIITTDGAGQLSFVDQSTLNSGSAERTEILVKNVHGSALSKGDPVYIIGSVGASDRLEVALANASDAAKMPCVGLLTQDLANNGEGTATVTGKLRNLITSPIDGATPTENDTIYVKSGGGLTLTKPTGSTNLIQNVGQVGRVSTSADGNIVVSAILRSNDIPNLPTGKIWVGDGNTTVSDVVYLDETNERMGIGTNSPDSKLEVASTDSNTYIHVRNDSTGSTRLKMSNLSDTNSNGFQIINNGSNGQVNLLNYKASTLALWTNTSQRMTILSGGNVGVGTTNPTRKLDVAGEIQGTNFFAETYRSARTDGDIYIQAATASDFVAIGTQASANLMRIDGGGNVGIGTTSPSYRLTAYGNSADSEIVASFGSANDQNEYTAIGLSGFIASNGATKAGLALKRTGTYGTGELHFLNNNTLDNSDMTLSDSKIMINSSGNVGIGTTLPAGLLEINGGTGVSTSGGTLIVRQDGDANTDGIALTSSNAISHRIWKDVNGKLNIGPSTLPSALVQDLSGNVGIGTTSPIAKLSVKSSGTNTWVVRATASDGGDLGGIYEDGGTNAELYLKNSAGTSSVLINSSGSSYLNGGNVGIGTTSPGAKLDIFNTGGNATSLSLAQTYSALTVKPYSSVDSKLTFSANSGNTQIIQATNNASTTGRTISLQPFGGNVGIGTTGPSTKLHVLGTTSSVPATGAAPSTAQFGASTYGTLFSTLSSGRGVIQQGRSDGTATSYDLLLNPRGGNVGIGVGTSVPAHTLDVYGTGRFTGDMHLGRYIFHDNDTNTWIGFPSNDTISFRTNGSDRMYINSSGNVGIGTTAPSSKLHIKDTSLSGTLAYFEASASAQGTTNVRIDCLQYGAGIAFFRDGTLGSSACSFRNDSGTQVGSISIGTSSTFYSTSSDYRLKENVTSITDGIARLKQLQPKRFNFIGDTSVVDGFIAHEAKQVVPEAVTGEKDEVLPNGDPLYQGIDQAKIVPLLTAALQEAITKIELLENRLQTLENK